MATAIACAGLAIGAGAAGATRGGSGGGGVGVPDPPTIADVSCSARCLDLRTVAETGRIEITGSGLDSTAAVKLKGEAAKLKVEPTAVGSDSVTARVPVGAVDGKVTVVTTSGVRAVSPAAIAVEPKDAIADAGGFSVESAEAAPAKSFFNADRESAVDYLFKSDGPADVRIDVVNRKTGETVDSSVAKHQRPFAEHSFEWDGLNAANKVARNGGYKFRISPLSGGAGASAGFSYYDHIFPLRGRHTYGAGLGAGRGHQGQDVFARCGTKIVAARGGRVQVNAYQSAAGYYVVIDGAKTGQDYFYAHMLRRGRPKEGTRVHTGDVIGYESDTGDASGCHLHFELWSAPGWYEGGHVLDPTGPLKRWDRYS